MSKEYYVIIKTGSNNQYLWNMYFELYQWVLKIINTEKKAVKKQINHISSLSFKLWLNIEILTYVITSILISPQGNMP